MAERLLERDLTATVFDPDAAGGDLPHRSRVVVIGAGIVGSSVADHLARLGQEVLVLERSRVASGTSWHAAGLVVRGRSSHTFTELASYGMQRYASLSAATGVDVNLVQCGSLTLARTPGRLEELQYFAGVCRHHDIPNEMVTPERVVELFPLAVGDGLVGALHQRDDGHVNPGLAALAFATSACEAGAVFREGVRVSGIRMDRSGRVTAVDTDQGSVECERVVLAAGLWTRDLAAACGASVPLWPAAHVHVQTVPLAGATIELPVLRDLDAYFYARHVDGRLLVGAFEPDGQPFDPTTLPADFSFGEFAADWAHFAPVRALAEERIPALRGVEWARFLNAPESFTPDANFCIGETAEVPGLFVAAGFNSQGIIYAPGAGRALAEWIVDGSPTVDVSDIDVQRFHRQQSNRRYLQARTVEGLGRLYAMHWPHLQPHTARNIRRTPLHDRLDAAGASFGELVGYERANWYAPAGASREYEYSYGRQNWFEHAAAEHRAARNGVALFDLSTFTKVEVVGRGALGVIQHVATQNLDVAVGRVVYTLFLNERGGIELDGTIARLAEDRFLVVTPTGLHTKTLSILRRAARDTTASVFDATSGLATIGVMGPSSRELLQSICRDDLSRTALAWGRTREIEVGNGFVRCMRVSFVGELGFELYPSADLAVDLYDSIVAAGADFGLRHAGYHALDSLRCEKGYRHVGHDIGPVDDPYQAALGYTVALDKPGGFVGRDSIAAARDRPLDRRQVFVRLADPDPLLLHGESILCNGTIVGRMTSGAYGHTIGGACGLGYIGGDVQPGEAFEVDCAGRLVPAVVSDTPFYDPGNERLRS